MDYFERALPIREEVGDRVGLATTLAQIGALYRTTGKVEQALDYFERSLEIMREVGAVHNVAAILKNIASLLHEMDRKEEAITHLEGALRVMEDAKLQYDGGTHIDQYRMLLALWRSGRILSDEQISQFLSNTAAVLGPAADQKEAWLKTLDDLIKKARKNNDANEQAFFTALSHLVRQGVDAADAITPDVPAAYRDAWDALLAHLRSPDEE